MAEESLRVLITGAAGRIGRFVAPRLPPEWDLRLTDLEASDGVAGLDITDLDACRAAFRDVDAVVHLAGDPHPTASFEELLSPNVVGAYTVAQAAVDCHVRRLVLASSIHAVSGTDDAYQVRSGDQPRPGNVYGATKAWVEALGAWVAFSSDTSVVALRIGYFLEEFSSAEVTRVGPPLGLAERAGRRRPGPLRRTGAGRGFPRGVRHLGQRAPTRRSDRDDAAARLPAPRRRRGAALLRRPTGHGSLPSPPRTLTSCCSPLRQ